MAEVNRSCKAAKEGKEELNESQWAMVTRSYQATVLRRKGDSKPFLWKTARISKLISSKQGFILGVGIVQTMKARKISVVQRHLHIQLIAD